MTRPNGATFRNLTPPNDRHAREGVHPGARTPELGPSQCATQAARMLAFAGKTKPDLQSNGRPISGPC